MVSAKTQRSISRRLGRLARCGAALVICLVGIAVADDNADYDYCWNESWNTGECMSCMNRVLDGCLLRARTKHNNADQAAWTAYYACKDSWTGPGGSAYLACVFKFDCDLLPSEQQPACYANAHSQCDAESNRQINDPTYFNGCLYMKNNKLNNNVYMEQGEVNVCYMTFNSWFPSCYYL
jgi:hypothetical protein